MANAGLNAGPGAATGTSKARSLGTRILQGLNLKSTSTSASSPGAGAGTPREDQPKPAQPPRPENGEAPCTNPGSKGLASKQQTVTEKENVSNVSKNLTSKSSTGGRCEGPMVRAFSYTNPDICGCTS